MSPDDTFVSQLNWDDDDPVGLRQAFPGDYVDEDYFRQPLIITPDELSGEDESLIKAYEQFFPGWPDDDEPYDFDEPMRWLCDARDVGLIVNEETKQWLNRDCYPPRTLSIPEILGLHRRVPLPPLHANVAIGTDQETGQEVVLPFSARDHGLAMVGKSGTGKSSILEHLILADLQSATPAVVIDPHGALSDRVIALAPAAAIGRIALLEPLLSQPFGLNLLEVRAPINDNDDPVTWVAESVLAAFKKLYRGSDAYQPRLEYYLPLAARTLAYNHATLAHIPELFEDPAFRQACLAAIPSSDRVTRNQWAAFERLRPRDRDERIDPLLSRITRLLQVAVIGRILASPQTTVPFDSVLDGHGLILLRLSSEWLPREECDLLGALFLSALTDRLFARSVQGGGARRLHIYVDEYQRFATPTVGELFTQGRKFGVGLTIAHQGRDQIDDERVRSAEVHAGSLILLRLTRADAEELAGELPIRPRPEWTEQVTEADGTEPVMTASAHAVQDLMSGRHPDPAAQAAGGIFREITERIGDMRKKADRYVRPRGFWMADELYEQSLQQVPVDLWRGLTRIDALLVVVMRGPLDPRSRPAIQCMVEILDDLRFYMGGNTELVPAYVSGSLKGGNRDVGKRAEALQGLLEETRCDDQVRWAGAFFAAARSRGLDKRHEGSSASSLETGPDPVYAVLRTIARGITDPYWDSSRKPPPGADAMVDVVYKTALILQKHPLLVPTDMLQPRMRTRSVTHPAQPYQDAQNELVDRLVNPADDYLAHYKGPRVGEYHVVKLRKPLAGGDVAAIERVRQASKARFARPPEPPPQPEVTAPATPLPPSQSAQPRPELPPDTGPPIGRR